MEGLNEDKHYNRKMWCKKFKISIYSYNNWVSMTSSFINWEILKILWKHTSLFFKVVSYCRLQWRVLKYRLQAFFLFSLGIATTDMRSSSFTSAAAIRCTPAMTAGSDDALRSTGHASGLGRALQKKTAQ